MRPGFALTRFGDQLDRFEVHPGVSMAPLGWTRPIDGSAPEPTSAFVWFEPGAEIPGDHHADSEEVNVVLRGELLHDGVVLGPDDVLTCDRGTTHSPSSPTGGPGAFLYVEFPDRYRRR
jgi:hypothetical protein